MSETNKTVQVGGCVSSVPPLSAEQPSYMKRITLSLFCLSVFTLSAIAQDTPAADNTRKNERDRSGETKTSGDQSNTREDVNTSAAIRRAVVKDHSFTLVHGEEREDYHR